MMDIASTHSTSFHEKIDASLKELTEAIRSGRNEVLTSYLSAMARFHQYSVGNILLIWTQMPQATQVAGFCTWKRLNRFVKHGEKGIFIMSYIFSKQCDSPITAGGASKPVNLKGVYVFDVSQTEGEPLLNSPTRTGGLEDNLNRLLIYAAELGIELRIEKLPPSVRGRSSGRVITINGTMSSAQIFAFITHQLALGMLRHQLPPGTRGRSSLEAEAEAVAFVVGRAVGLESTTGSSEYIQLNRGKSETLAASLRSIQQTARTILHGIMPDPLES